MMKELSDRLCKVDNVVRVKVATNPCQEIRHSVAVEASL